MYDIRQVIWRRKCQTNIIRVCMMTMIHQWKSEPDTSVLAWFMVLSKTFAKTDNSFFFSRSISFASLMRSNSIEFGRLSEVRAQIIQIKLKTRVTILSTFLIFSLFYSRISTWSIIKCVPSTNIRDTNRKKNCTEKIV